MGMKKCDNYRKKVSQHKNESQLDISFAPNVLPCSSKEKNAFIDPNVSLNYLNQTLELIEESPVKKKKVHVKSYTSKNLIK